MTLSAHDRNALMEAIEIIQHVQNGQPITPNPSVRLVLMTILQRSIQEDVLNKQTAKPI